MPDAHEWRLDLDAWRWERLTDRAWPRYYFVRTDRAANHLFWLRRLLLAGESRRPDRFADCRAQLLRDIGSELRLDLVETLYSPDIAHTKVPAIEGEFRVHRVSIDGVTVRYVEDDHAVGMTVEGELPSEIVELLRSELLYTLVTIENTSVDCVPVLAERESA